MTYKLESPKVTKGDGLHTDERYDHPAFGCVSVSRCQAGGKWELFGSALNHQHFISIKVDRAYLDRGLHYDRISSNLSLVEFQLSEAQWAQFVAGAGSGSPTPCTFRYYTDGNLVNVPGIKSIEKIKDTFSREIKEKATEYVAEAKAIAADLETLVESGKLGKTELRKIQNRMATFSGNFASNMQFTQDMFAEAMEKTVEAGKSEIEGFIAGTAQRLGLDELAVRASLPQLKDESKKDDEPV